MSQGLARWSNASRLLALPIELRDLIYDFLTREKCHKLYYDGDTGNLSTGYRHTGKTFHYPEFFLTVDLELGLNILLVNRQIGAEYKARSRTCTTLEVDDHASCVVPLHREISFRDIDIPYTTVNISIFGAEHVEECCGSRSPHQCCAVRRLCAWRDTVSTTLLASPKTKLTITFKLELDEDVRLTKASEHSQAVLGLAQAFCKIQNVKEIVIAFTNSSEQATSQFDRAELHILNTWTTVGGWSDATLATRFPEPSITLPAGYDSQICLAKRQSWRVGEYDYDSDSSAHVYDFDD